MAVLHGTASCSMVTRTLVWDGSLLYLRRTRNSERTGNKPRKRTLEPALPRSPLSPAPLPKGCMTSLSSATSEGHVTPKLQHCIREPFYIGEIDLEEGGVKDAYYLSISVYSRKIKPDEVILSCYPTEDCYKFESNPGYRVSVSLARVRHTRGKLVSTRNHQKCVCICVHVFEFLYYMCSHKYDKNRNSNGQNGSNQQL